jgi:PAS domain S-box-containing protein
MNTDKKSKLRERIEAVLKHKATNLENAYTKNLEELIEDLKIYQYELEFQNDELQRIHLELEESRNEYRMLFHYAPVGYVIISEDFEVLDCNETFRKMIKWDIECSKKMDFRQFIDPDFQDAFHHFCNGLINNQNTHQLEIKMNGSGDGYIYANIVGSFSSGKNSSRLFLSINDISEKRKIEEDLFKIRELLLQTSRMARVGGWEIDMTTKIAKWSDVIREIVEVEPDYEPDLENSVGFFKEGTSRQTIQHTVKEAAERGTPFDEELQIVTAKGNLKWVRALGKAEFNNEMCTRIYGTFQDIDEKKKQQEILQQSEKKLKELNSTKDKLFSIIAHDLKSPFNSILGLSELLKEDAADCDPQNILKYSKMINASATQAYNLLENLLGWARMQLGNVQTYKEFIHLKEEVDSVFYFLSSQTDAKNIKRINKVPHNFKIFADGNTVKTVLRNLLSNAVKFTQAGGSISISAEVKGAFAQITVADTGIGIKQEDIEKLFKQGEYFTTPGTQNEKGTGLGLMLCKEFIEIHNGKIWVESEEGNGSAFCFTIPLGK